MPRYVVERYFGNISDEEMLAAASRSERIQSERYPDIVWDHSHICVGDEGAITSFCVYEAPDEAMVREHADAFGSHSIKRIYEVVDEVTPAEVRRRVAATS